jgi:bla regulator protein blaR1
LIRRQIAPIEPSTGTRTVLAELIQSPVREALVMWVELDRFSRVLANATLAETVFLTFVVLVMLSCQQPARRIVVAKAAILLSALMIPLAAYNPFPRFHPRAWFDGQASRELAAERLHAGEPLLPGASAGTIPGSRQLSSGMSRESSWWGSLQPARLLTLAYLAGVSIGLVWFLLGFWALAWLISRSQEASPETRALYDALARHAGEPRSAPALRVSSRVRRPVLAGLVHPYILIPHEFDRSDLDRESLQIILTHELAHATQGDSRFSAGASLAQSLWFFLPFLWWLRVSLRTDQEFLADRRTALLSGSPTGYARRLVSLAAPESRSPFRRSIIDSMSMLSGRWRTGGFKTQLLQRVVMLLHCPFEIELYPPRMWALSATVLLVGLATICSTINLFASGPDGARTAIPSPRIGQRRFRVAEFVAVPQVVSRTGRSTPYVLPLALPARWELNVEIQASLPALRRIRIAGLMLDPGAEGGLASAENRSLAGSSPSWHQIQLRHDDRQTLLDIDGKAFPLRPEHEALSGWLTIEPAADQTAVLRNLMVTW